MYSLFLTVILFVNSDGSINSATNPIDNKTFNTVQECEQYKRKMGYKNDSHLVFHCILSN